MENSAVRRFFTHTDFVAACEQLADELVDFITSSANLEIRIICGIVSEDTKLWLGKVSDLGN
jgi:hypothetical protein